MNIFDIYIAFVSWGSGGKRRPVLVLDKNAGGAVVFNITTHYFDKNEKIRAKYFIINDWQQAGLDRQSYIDTNNTITVPLTAVDSKKRIGRLSLLDEKRLIEFVNQLQKQT
ncbi:MAG: hypothetical protein FWD03_02730 [Defluviitaleaceae bacterium]|nr:hypothetical protein [Defluviitaleaceae bacterium]